MFSTPTTTRCSSRAAVVVGGWRAPISPPDAVIEIIRTRFTLDESSGQIYRDGKPVGYKTTAGYIRFAICRRRYFAHRVVWFMTHGEWPSHEVDHINGIRTDNRPENLRNVTRLMNSQNVGAAHVTNSTTGLLGTHYHASNGKNFRAQIWVNGKNRHIGYFETAMQAHQAYLEAKAALHPGFVPERFV